MGRKQYFFKVYHYFNKCITTFIHIQHIKYKMALRFIVHPRIKCKMALRFIVHPHIKCNVYKYDNRGKKSIKKIMCILLKYSSQPKHVDIDIKQTGLAY